MDGTGGESFSSGVRRTGLGSLERILYFIGGADPDLLAECPARDRHLIGLIAIILAVVWCFHVCLITFSLTIAFGASLLGVAGSFVGALIAATLIVGFDMLVIRGVHHHRGLIELKEHGLYQAPSQSSDGPDAAIDMVVAWLPIVFRFLLSFCAANLIAIFFMTFFFRDDITSELVRQYALRNAPVVAEARRSVDAEVATLNQSIAADTKLADAAAARKAAMGQALSAPAADSPDGQELAVLVARVADLQHKVAQAQDDVRTNTFGANDEAGGIKEYGASGQPKKGDKYFARAANLRDAQQQLADYTRDLAIAQAQLADAQSKSRTESLARASAMARITDQPDVEESAAIARIATARAKLSDLANHGASVLKAAQQTVPVSAGPFARLDALFHLTSSSAGARAVSIAVEFFIMALELSAVVGMLANRIPMTYTRRLAELDIAGAQAGILRLIEQEGHLIASMQRWARAQAPQPPSSPPAAAQPLNGQGPAPRPPTPLNGAAPRPSRPAPQGDGFPRAEPPATNGHAPANGATPPATPRPAGIPFMIPTWARKVLREIGFSIDQIKHMTPTVAFNILNERGLWEPPQ